MNRIQSHLLVLLLLFATSAASAQNMKRFVYAPSGLNLRESSDPASKKLKTVPFGSELKLIKTASDNKMTVDHLKGGMAQVEFEGQKGYMFDGYLSLIRPGTKNAELKKYTELLRDDGLDILYEHHNYDYGGYYRDEEGITVPTDSWQEVFLVAKQLYEIPKGIHFPGKGESSIANPDKKEHVWSDELTVGRNKEGKIIEMHYGWRAEGGGWFVTFQKSEEMSGTQIMHGSIAD